MTSCKSLLTPASDAPCSADCICSLVGGGPAGLVTSGGVGWPGLAIGLGGGSRAMIEPGPMPRRKVGPPGNGGGGAAAATSGAPPCHIANCCCACHCSHLRAHPRSAVPGRVNSSSCPLYP